MLKKSLCLIFFLICTPTLPMQCPFRTQDVPLFNGIKATLKDPSLYLKPILATCCKSMQNYSSIYHGQTTIKNIFIESITDPIFLISIAIDCIKNSFTKDQLKNLPTSIQRILQYSSTSASFGVSFAKYSVGIQNNGLKNIQNQNNLGLLWNAGWFGHYLCNSYYPNNIYNKIYAYDSNLALLLFPDHTLPAWNNPNFLNTNYFRVNTPKTFK